MFQRAKHVINKPQNDLTRASTAHVSRKASTIDFSQQITKNLNRKLSNYLRKHNSYLIKPSK